ncbi:hypothetical protein Bca4012_002899 [Brassica carinata]|uniref:Uncharacterized protein n=1 Tax=Brassica carinata TaxID=52824 RepID=A0A8X7RZ29_BRACI|nr:hypothetical protein Bca52824_042374 [Brassica carinata]
MEMHVCGLETLTQKIKSDFHAFKTDLKEEMTKSQSTRFYNFYRLKLPPLQHNQTPAQRQDRWCSAELGL